MAGDVAIAFATLAKAVTPLIVGHRRRRRGERVSSWRSFRFPLGTVLAFASVGHFRIQRGTARKVSNPHSYPLSPLRPPLPLRPDAPTSRVGSREARSVPFADAFSHSEGTGEGEGREGQPREIIRSR